MSATPTLGPKKDLYKKSYGNFHVAVYYLTQHRTIVYEMEGYIMPEHVDAYVADLLAEAKRHRPFAMVADPRKMKVLNEDFQQAIKTKFWPEIARYGVRKNPAIDPSAHITKASVNRMVREMGQTIDVGDGRVLDIAILPSLEDCLAYIAGR